MSRRPVDRPWLHAASGQFCATVGGRRVYLDRDYRVACRKLRERIADAKRRAAGAEEWLDRQLVELADKFLEHIQQTRKKATYTGYQARLGRALKYLPRKLRVGEIRKRHLADLEAALPNKLSPTTIRDTIATVQTLFSWAVRNEYLDVNPLVGFRKPAARVRTRIISDSEFQSLLRAATRSPAFRRVMIALRQTGCRPGELRALTWDMVDLKAGLWILPDHKTVTRQRKPRPRVIPLPKVVWKLCQWLFKRASDKSGPVFRNMFDLPYTKDCITTYFDRLRMRAGIEKKAGENLVLYSHRHTFATERAGRVADIELAELLGHTDTQMIPRYTHFNVERLQDIQRRAEARR